MHPVTAEDFGQIAKVFSEAGTAEVGGLLGPLKRGDLSPQLEKIAFGLEVGAEQGSGLSPERG